MRHLVLTTFVMPGMWAHFARSDIGQGTPDLHDHDFHELFWIESGRGRMRTDGDDVVLAPGFFALIHAKDQHGFAALPGAPLRMANMAFPIAAWRAVVRRYRRDDPMEWPAHRRRRLLGADELGALRLAAGDLDHGLRDRLAGERILLTALGLLREAPRPTALPSWLAEGIGALERGRWRDGTAALVAASGRSREHVARVCRELLGTTPTALVTDARLRHFARRLVESDEPIATLAAETGLENLAHLYRLFRRAHGVSPGTWRKRHREVIRPGE